MLPFSIIVLFLLMAMQVQGQVVTTPNKIIAFGSSIVSSPPDTSFISFTTKTKSKSAAEAFNSNKYHVSNLYAALKGGSLHILSNHLRTSNIALREEFDIRNTNRFPPGRGKKVSRGFTASSTVEVRVNDLSVLNDLISTGIEEGNPKPFNDMFPTATTTTGINNLRFELSEDIKQEAENAALELAIQDANVRTKTAANASGSTIIGVLKILANPQRRSIPREHASFARAAPMAADAMISTPVSVGEFQTSSKVELHVEIE